MEQKDEETNNKEHTGNEHKSRKKEPGMERGMMEPPRRDGGKQGGVETPDMFNRIIEYLFCDVVKKWEDLNMGITIGDNVKITHLWCEDLGSRSRIRPYWSV